MRCNGRVLITALKRQNWVEDGTILLENKMQTPITFILDENVKIWPYSHKVKLQFALLSKIRPNGGWMQKPAAHACNSPQF